MAMDARSGRRVFGWKEKVYKGVCVVPFLNLKAFHKCKIRQINGNYKDTYACIQYIAPNYVFNWAEIDQCTIWIYKGILSLQENP